ncbi:MAG: DNA-directed RNA polymerase subunit alpha [candidate division WS6 bacterium 34_10]|uniref:DNA-directed RNA polymerase subunit alpha n=1 Tax=candidate division WS6 bacterium 34_10 TaxID=1641389 RepID=A0A101HJC7_9BACT|nr:MAG: DNA-directed RNA polymerase subunit alpha [candidate division WS6 bacterium 34_10]
MEDFKDIKVIIKDEEENYGLFEISPLPRGYGHTLGNALRRILYSSLPGAGVTQVKVKGAKHEYSTLDGVKEDVLNIILNLKQVKFVVNTDEPQTCKIKVSGKKKVTSEDIERDADVEITSEEIEIATITDDSGELDMEFTVERGVGYRDVKDIDRPEAGVIPVDCDFSPIERVSLSVEQARKGQKTDLDAVVIGVLTDGTIQPQEALLQSAKTMQEFAGRVMISMGMAQKEVEELAEAATEIEVEEEEVEEENEVHGWKIEDLPISKRSKTGLLSGGYKTVGDLRDATKSDLLNLQGFGNKSLNEVVELLSEYGVEIKSEE